VAEVARIEVERLLETLAHVDSLTGVMAWCVLDPGFATPLAMNESAVVALELVMARIARSIIELDAVSR
jgi:hypothetical protein